MKWYSVKKYRPPVNIEFFIITDYGHIYTACYDGTFYKDNREIISNASHFCIPDPVEIEE